jgi:hypothetical protein
MSTQTCIVEEVVIERGIEALMHALGPIETARFLNLPGRRILDYVEWHRQWQEGLDLAAFLDEVLAVEASVAGQATATASDLEVSSTSSRRRR